MRQQEHCSKLNLRFWAEAVNTTVYIHNRVKSRVHKRTFYEIWYERLLNVKDKRTFGCTANVLKKRGQERKFEMKTQRGIFVAYGENNTYRIYYIPESNRILRDRDVKYLKDENGSEWLQQKEDKRKEKTMWLRSI